MTQGTLTVQTPAVSGAKITWTTGIADGFAFTNTGKERLLVKNVSADTARTIGVTSGGTVSTLDVANISQSIPFGETWSFGPFPKYLFDKAATDLVETTFPETGYADLLVALVRT